MGSEEGEIRLDDHLEELAAGIVNRMQIDPPDVKAKLQPPQLRVVKTSAHLFNNFCVSTSDGQWTIFVGAEVYPFVHHYTRVAATYFLPIEPDGARPSPFWDDARSALATTLDWSASPATVPRYPGFNLSSHQAHVARAFRAYTYRFALCHEMAHVALEHLGEGPLEPSRIGDETVQALRTSQAHELSADRFGLSLQIKSLENSQLVTGLASTIYFVHIVGLLDLRLSLLGNLVDPGAWKVARTHPPTLHRLQNLMAAAEALYRGAGDALMNVHEGLTTLDGQLYAEAQRKQEAAFAAVSDLIDSEATHYPESVAVESGSESDGLGDIVTSSPRPQAKRAILQHFDQSPLGTIRALEPSSVTEHGDSDREHGALRQALKVRFASILPEEFQQFRQQTRAQRAEQAT